MSRGIDVRRRQLRGRIRPSLVLLLGVLAAGFFLFPHAGRFLVAEDRFEKADLAVVLSGDSVGRGLAARDLYREGRVRRFLVVPEPPNPVEPELVRMGLEKPSLPQWGQRILLASGVAPADIVVLPTPADGTIDEALRVRAFLRGKQPASLVLVTSKFASRRARFIFRWVLHGEKLKIWSYPCPYDPYDPRDWWDHPRQAFYVVMEYQKFLWNALTLALGLYHNV